MKQLCGWVMTFNQRKLPHSYRMSTSWIKYFSTIQEAPVTFEASLCPENWAASPVFLWPPSGHFPARGRQSFIMGWSTCKRCCGFYLSWATKPYFKIHFCRELELEAERKKKHSTLQKILFCCITSRGLSVFTAVQGSRMKASPEKAVIALCCEIQIYQIPILFPTRFLIGDESKCEKSKHRFSPFLSKWWMLSAQTHARKESGSNCHFLIFSHSAEKNPLC